MRFWITKNSELPVREQLIRQVVLGILSEDLPPGHKLPSVRALARRHHIHANTVSSAYHALLQEGWLELRRGSGLFVRPQTSAGLDQMLAKLLQSASSQGHQPEEVLQRLEHLVRPRSYQRILIYEPDPAMREIIQAEISKHRGVPIEAAESGFGDESQFSSTVVVALPSRAAKLQAILPEGVLFVQVKLHSMREALEGQTRPGPEVIISIASRSPEIRHWARTMLLAVGLDPYILCEIDAGTPGWLDRVRAGGLVVTDAASATELQGSGYQVRVIRVIADASLATLKQLCPG